MVGRRGRSADGAGRKEEGWTGCLGSECVVGRGRLGGWYIREGKVGGMVGREEGRTGYGLGSGCYGGRQGIGRGEVGNLFGRYRCESGWVWMVGKEEGIAG